MRWVCVVLLSSAFAATMWPSSAVAAECTDTWTGAAEGSWSTAENWSQGHVPTETDVACIGSGKTAVVEASTNAAIVQGEGTIAIFSGTLELTLSPSEGSSNIANLEINGGTLNGAGKLVISKTLTWKNGGAMSGSGPTVLASGATGALSFAFLSERTFVNEGNLALTSSIWSIGSGAQIDNVGTFTINAESEEELASGLQRPFGGPAPVLVNTGTVRKTEGTGEGQIRVAVENEGLIDVETGKLKFGSGATSTLASGSTIEGTVSFFEQNVHGGAFTATNGTFEAGPISEGITFEGSGTASIANLVLKSNLTGTGNVEVTNSLTWTNSIMEGSGTTSIAASATGSLNGVFLWRKLVNKGTLTQATNFLSIGFGGELDNRGTYNANVEAELDINEGGGARPLIVNAGTFQKTAGSGTTEVDVRFENRNVIREPSGKLKFTKLVTVAPLAPTPCHCHHGDPVDSATGNFTESQTDFAIGGRGLGLVLTRTYNAQPAAKAESPGAFGYGWSNSYGDHLSSEEEGKRVMLTQADGGTVPFTEASKGVYAPPVWSQDALTGSAETGYTLTTPDQTKYKFSGEGRLESLTDRNGNETTLAYTEAGKLETITDPVSRKITLTYNGEGLVESAEDPMSHTVKYTYEGQDLKTVTLPGEAEANWTFKYDGSHRITSMTDGRGGKTSNEYDESNRVISQTDPTERETTFEYAPFHTKVTNEATGAVTDEWFTSNNSPFSVTHGLGTASATTDTFTYNDEGQLLSHTDGNGHKTTYAYDEHGNRTSETDAVEDQTKWTYNETHDVLSETTPEGEKTTIKRDAHGNPETISRPAPKETTQTTTFEYGTHGELESVTDPLERTTNFEYDAKGNRKTAINPAGDKRTWAYDEDSRVTSMVSPRGNEEGAEAAKFTTTIERDAQERPKEVIDPLEHVTKYAYDPNGNLETLTDPKSHETTYTYNADNELTKVEKPNGDLLETGYDGAGQVTSQTDGTKHTTTYKRNVLEQPTEVIDPLERKTTLEYDSAGNLKSETDPDERKTTYVYDAANRLKEFSYSDGVTPTVKLSYNKDSQLKTMSDGTGESTFTYDLLGRLTESKNGHGSTVGYTYNLANEPTEITYPNGKVISQAFDTAGRLEKVSDWLGHNITFAYNHDSGLKTSTFPEGTGNVDEYTYDRADLISEVKAKKGAETLSSLAYARDKAGLIEKQISKGLPGAEETTYEYDSNNRLTKAGGGSYEYDAADNMTKAPGTTNAYDKASQIETGTGVTYSFNKEGQRTKLTPSGSPATTYKYDQAGNLTAVERTKEGEVPAIAESFGYDGGGLMASRKVGETTSYLTWSAIGSLPLLLSDGQNSYLYGPGGVPVEQISSETATYYHHDQLGSTRLLTNSSGSATGTFSYGAYGTLTGSTGSQTTPLGFAGQYTNSQSGLQYLRARVYDPATGQFLTRDPIEALTGQPYGYAEENPINAFDPSGLSGCGDIFVVSTLCNLGQESGMSDAAAGALDTLTFGQSTSLAGRVFGFDPSCADFGTSGQIGSALGLGFSFFDGEGELELGAKGFGQIAGGTLRGEDVLSAGERWLGEGYQEVAPGVYRSADGTRQFRMTPTDLGDSQPHVHFEYIGPNGRTENAHVYLK